MHRLLFAFVLTVAAAAVPAHAAESTPAAMTPAENAFVAAIRADLTKRFPTPRDAERAGYIRYGNEDETGAISYENGHWASTKRSDPAQLWYDVKGRLLGADYSELQSQHPQPVALLGVSPSRLQKIGAHVHYVEKMPDGTLVYDKAIGAKKYAATGLDLQHPTAAGLVKAGAVPSADRVKAVFLYPAIWDLAVWVLPNPSGAFAEKNPNVTPAHAAGAMR